ncbi:MAG: extracellular solute-binding protein [Thermoflexales bacterium]|nr:extracellular solute-binding protein [Thermoflexales bacterium]MDW8054791.1 extracellular solute-binding protein [Anaerolineae bacterium]MDW8292909.1 extracellular solute-binding protein [Anaerolineae bacterium]
MSWKKATSLATFAVLLLAACQPMQAPTSAPQQPTQPPAPQEQPTQPPAPQEQPTQPPAEGKRFAGITINAITFSGPQIAEPMQRRGKEFSELTGATVNVVTVPFADLYQKILNDFATGTNSYDVIVFAPQWLVDYVDYLEDLTDRVNADKDLQWEDIAPFFRDFSSTYNGRIYTIPLDGDFQMVYYRTDIAQQLGLKPPQTWEDYIAFAKAVSEAKLTTDDGKPVYGSCIAKKKAAQSYWMVASFAAAFLQSQGTSQGAFFDLETFKPLFGDNEGFRRALELYKETTKYGPPDEINLDVGDTRGLWTAGQCALTVDWGDIGTLAIEEGSKVKDKTGAVILPGSRQVLDRKTGKLVDCTPELCPHAIDGVNHAPYAAFGGWSGAINKASKPEVKDAAFAYLSYMNQPAQSNVDVTIGKTGFNPYRISQFENLDNWIKAGMSEQAAKDYLGAIKASLNSPNMVLDLRIPQNNYYQGIVLDGAIAKFLADEQDLDATVKEIEQGWEEKTEELGRDKQLAAYKATLGVQR